MNSQVSQEFKSSRLTGELDTRIGSTFTWDSPRLTTMYPRPGAPKGSDRAVCRTVNGLLRVSVLENREALLGPNTGVSVTAGLWGEYNRVPGVLASTKYYLEDIYANFVIQPAAYLAVLFGLPRSGWGVPIFDSNGALGFNAWNSFSNHAQNVYIKLSFVRENPPVDPAKPYTKIPIKIQCSGLLIAADPA